MQGESEEKIWSKGVQGCQRALQFSLSEMRGVLSNGKIQDVASSSWVAGEVYSLSFVGQVHVAKSLNRLISLAWQMGLFLPSLFAEIAKE